VSMTSEEMMDRSLADAVSAPLEYQQGYGTVAIALGLKILVHQMSIVIELLLLLSLLL